MADPVPSGARTRLGVVFLVLFLDLVGFSMVFPLYRDMLRFYLVADTPLMHAVMVVVRTLGPNAGSDQQAALFGGVLAAIYGGLQFLVAPLWGRLSDRFGRRPILLLSILGTTTAYLLWIFASRFEVLILSRMIAGIMTGNVSVANAAVADITTPQTRGRGMAAVGMAFGLGFILGPAIGGFSWAMAPHGFLGNPFAVPALVAFVLSLANLCWALQGFHETLPRERRTTAAETARTISLTAMLDPALGAGVSTINSAFLLHTLLFAGMEATLVFLAGQRCGFQPQDNALLFCWMGLLSVVVQGGIFRRLVGRLGPRRLTLLGLALMPPGMLAIAAVDLVPHAVVLYAATAILACGTGLVFPGLSAMASLAGDPHRQGWVMGTFRSAGSLGRAVGPLLGASAYFLLRPAAPYLVSAVGMCIPLLLIQRLRLPAPAAPAAPPA